jgi:hypothetical protein
VTWIDNHLDADAIIERLALGDRFTESSPSLGRRGSGALVHRLLGPDAVTQSAVLAEFSLYFLGMMRCCACRSNPTHEQ